MDMSRALRNAVEKILPQAVIVIDKYHVQGKAKNAVDIFLKSLAPPADKKIRKQYRRDRFLLYSRPYNLSELEQEQLQAWNQDVPRILNVYHLKEQFMNIWRFTRRADAERAFAEWKNEIPPQLKFVFREILTCFENWGGLIFNYFDYPFTNAFTESMNRRIKMIQKQSCSCGFWMVRAKMLCREYFRQGGKDGSPYAYGGDYRYVKPMISQKNLRLKQSYERNSKLFITMFPPADWLKRFEPHLKLITKTRLGDSGRQQRPQRKRATKKRK